METFRDYLDGLIRTRGYQYAELAREIGVTKSYIGQLVHGHSKPPPRERCDQIADALGLDGAERQRLMDLAVRERARGDSRAKMEELEGELRRLRRAAGGLLGTLAHSMAENDESLGELLSDLAATEDGLPDWSTDRLAGELTDLAAAFRSADTPVEFAQDDDVAPLPSRPPIPIIGNVAAGETDIAFTDGGLPAGASLPGEDPIPRWATVGDHAYALRISGESMMPLCPPGILIVVDPERTPREGEPAICQTTEGKSYFKLVHFESGGAVRLESTNAAVAPDILLQRAQVRRLQKVIATVYP